MYDQRQARMAQLRTTWLINPERRILYRWSCGFFLMVILLSLALGLRYLLLYSLPSQPLGLIYTFCAFIGHFALIGFLPWLLLVLPLCTIIPVRRIVIPVSILAGACVLTLLVLDGLVFAENRFHFNALTVTILGWKTWGFGILYAVILLVFLSFIAQWAWKRYVTQAKKLWGWRIGAVTVILLLATHGMHIWAEATYYTPITRFTTYLPVFYPATARRFMVKHGLVDIQRAKEKQVLDKISQEHRGDLVYPLNPLRFEKPAQRLNIVMIIIDALRAGVVHDSITPNLCALASAHTSFGTHYSGGNSTRMGVFSLFYGLPSTYQQVFEDYQCPPVLMNAALDCGYDVSAFSSTPFYMPANLESTVFARIPASKLVWHSSGVPMYARDSLITEQWFSWLNTRDTAAPFFGLLFYTAPNAFNYPPSYAPGLKIPKQATALQKRFAGYCAGARYNDSLTGAVIRDLDSRNLLSSTVILITADHGEEFDENGMGFKGHGSAYSEFQTHIPLVALWPGKAAEQVTRRTSHYDISATLMKEIFGCANPPSDFCSGKNLFDDISWEWLVVGSYYNFAVLEPEQVTVQFPGGYFEVRDRAYRIIKKPHLNTGVLTLAFNETARFFRK